MLKGIIRAPGQVARLLGRTVAAIWQDVLIVAGAGCIVAGINLLVGFAWALMAAGALLIMFGWALSGNVVTRGERT